MDNRRLFLYIALALMIFVIWSTWRTEHPAQPHPKTVSSQPHATSRSTRSNYNGKVASAPRKASITSQSERTGMSPGSGLPRVSGNLIHIKTNTLDIVLDLTGGKWVRVSLLKYAQTLKRKNPVHLLSTNLNNYLTINQGIGGLSQPPKFRTSKKSFALQPNQSTLVVPLSWVGPNGIKIMRTLILHRNSYKVVTHTKITNKRKSALHVELWATVYGTKPKVNQHWWHHFTDPGDIAYRGPAYYTGSSYEKIPFSSIAPSKLDKTLTKGWAGAVLQYFDAIVIPPEQASAHYTIAKVDAKHYRIGYRLPEVSIPAGTAKMFTQSLYLGPKLQGKLNQVAPGLSRTVDYGKATIICVPLFWILSHIHGLVGNWGWSIILLVLLVKVVFYWPQRASARSMAKMREVQPRIKQLQERYKDDKQKLSQAMTELWRKEGVNPVGGCLPMLLQMPIFFGLFYMLTLSVELRHAPWVLWIRDLSAPDPYYILPAIFAVVMFFQYRLYPQAADKNQARLMAIMPFGLAVLYAFFPSGLVLYYLVSTILNVWIQYQINRELGINRKRKTAKR